MSPLQIFFSLPILIIDEIFWPIRICRSGQYVTPRSNPAFSRSRPGQAGFSTENKMLLFWRTIGYCFPLFFWGISRGDSNIWGGGTIQNFGLENPASWKSRQNEKTRKADYFEENIQHG